MTTETPHWRVDTERLAREIRIATSQARTEEDLKLRVEPLFQRVFKEVGVDIDARQYEKTTRLAGRMDAVYGYLVIEYKAPGKLAIPRARAEVMKQVQGYLTEEATRHGSDTDSFLEKAVGVAFDGEQVAFIRYTRRAQLLPTPVPVRDGQTDLFPSGRLQKGFQIQGPFPINRQSLASLLIYVRSARRKPLTAENLAAVFGPGNQVARIAVAELYSGVMRGQRKSAYPRLTAFYGEWDRIFGAVYGEKLEKAEKAAEETARLYEMAAAVRLKPLLFAIHTYYALLMKLIAHELLALQQEDFGVRSFVEGIGGLDDEQLKERLGYLESGADFNALGIVNFLEADFFSWYLDAWSSRLALAARGIVRALADFEPATPVLEPEWTRDLLQQLYELIVPRVLRHSLGEYYTPDWLAGYLVDRSQYSGDPRRRFLDPACGSGTFLVQAIRRATLFAASQPRAKASQVGRSILNGVVGFDLNPLAVLAARTNYLIAFAKFLPYVRPLSIPVYLCDSVVPPDQSRDQQGSLFEGDTVVFRAGEHEYVFPLAMKNKERIDRFCAMVIEGLRSKVDAEAFQRRLGKESGLVAQDRARLADVYRHIKRLDDQKRDGIWAHYIKNAFAPVYMGKFDFVVGNPPWIRWGYLSGEYRARTLKLWHEYGLFSLKGHETRLGGGEKDFSMLFTYACADRYLTDNGRLAFVITGEVFKSKGAGEGFRRFKIGASGADLKILWMEDMVDLQPFQAANKTTIFALDKGKPTKYPVSTVEWTRKPGIGRIPPHSNLESVLQITTRDRHDAVPIQADKRVSSWQTGSRSQLKQLSGLKGKNAYKAHIGARMEPYGIFWLNLVEVRPDGLLVVENQHDRGKTDLKHVRTALEPVLVYPAVAGGNLVRYGVESHFYSLIVQDPTSRRGFAEDWLTENHPLTHAYLLQFKKELVARAAYQKYYIREVKKDGKVIKRIPTGPFYSMYNISNETFAPYRVAWKRMAERMSATVLGKRVTPFGRKEVVSTDTTSFIVARNRDEAHYLCAILNSAVVNDYIASFSGAGRGFGAPSVMSDLGIPKFADDLSTHAKLAALSDEAHKRVEQGKSIDDIDVEVDATAKLLWNIRS